MKFPGAIVILLFSFNIFAEESKVLGGCVVGISEVIKAHQKNFSGFNKNQIEAFKTECKSLINRDSIDSSEEKKKASTEHPYMYGCGLGAGAALRSVKGKQWYAEILIDQSKLIKEVKTYCL